MKDLLTIAASCLAVVGFAACAPFFAPATPGIQPMPDDAQRCYVASGIPVYVVADDPDLGIGACPPAPLLREVIDQAGLSSTDKYQLRIVVVDQALYCGKGHRMRSCSDGWTIFVRREAIRAVLAYELRSLYDVRLLGFTPSPAPTTDYMSLPGW